MFVPLGPRYRNALERCRKRIVDKSTEELEQLAVTIAQPEFMAVPASHLQWAEDLADPHVEVARNFIDNTNAVAWTEKHFAGNPIGQDLGRIAGGIEHALSLPCP